MHQWLTLFRSQDGRVARGLLNATSPVTTVSVGARSEYSGRGDVLMEKGGWVMRIELTTKRVIVAGTLVAAFVASAIAGPVVTGSQVRSFLGNTTGKLVFTKLDCNDASCDKKGRSLYYLDFSEENLTEHKIIDYYDESVEPRNTVISPDGQWISYNTLNVNKTWQGNKLYIARLQANVGGTRSLGDGALPHWWRKPGTDELYVIYNTRDLENDGWAMSWPPTNSETRIQRVDPGTMQLIGSDSKLIQYQANGGRSTNGKWLFAAGGFAGTFRIDAYATANATIHEDVYFGTNPNYSEDDLDGCNPSISPHAAEDDTRVLYLDKPHTGYHICDVRGGNREHIDWNNSENPYLDEPEWSTHPNFFTGKASRNNMDPPYDIYIVRISDHAKLKVLDGNYSFPHMWVDYDPSSVRRSGAMRTPSDVRVAADRTSLRFAGALDARATVSLFDARGRNVTTARIGRDMRVDGLDLRPGRFLLEVREGSTVLCTRSVLVR